MRAIILRPETPASDCIKVGKSMNSTNTKKVEETLADRLFFTRQLWKSKVAEKGSYNYTLFHAENKGIDDITGNNSSQCSKYLQLATCSGDFLRVLEDDQRNTPSVFLQMKPVHNDAKVIKALSDGPEMGDKWKSVQPGREIEARMVSITSEKVIPGIRGAQPWSDCLLQMDYVCRCYERS